MRFRVLLLLLLTYYGVTVLVDALPDFIRPCRRDDPQLNECATRNGRLAIPGLVAGSRAYGIPRMTPLHLPHIEIRAGNGLHIDLTDVVVSGLPDTKVSGVEMQLDKQHIVLRVSIPRVNVVGHYVMGGRVLMLPVNGDGAANITIIDGDFEYSMEYKLEERAGQQYAGIVQHNITFNPRRAYYRFTNLFDGNPVLGAQMNQFLDENWAEVTKDLGSTVGETVGTIITAIAQAVFKKVPFDEALPLA